MMLTIKDWLAVYGEGGVPRRTDEERRHSSADTLLVAFAWRMLDAPVAWAPGERADIRRFLQIYAGMTKWYA